MTLLQIDSFRHDPGIISFDVDENFPVLIIIPNSLSSGPFEILLNEKLNRMLESIFSKLW